MIRVEIFQTSDGTWYLQSYCVENGQVYMLLTFERFIFALNVAQALQLHVDNINEIELNTAVKQAA